MVEKDAARKQTYFAKLLELLDKYPKLLIVGCDNVGSSHMQKIRIALRGKAVLLMGKNTMIRKAIKGHISKNPQLEILLPHIKGNVGFVFTNDDLNEIRNLIVEKKVEAAAKAGALSPCDVLIPAGNTGLDPSQTSFMQALNIATRINKGQVEIINDVHLCKKGEKVGSSEAALLQKLNILPFAYGLVPLTVYDSGSIFSPDLLDLKDSDILSKFLVGIQKLASLSLATAIPTPPALPHYLVNAYQNLLAISISTDYTFERAAKLKEALENPEAFLTAAPVEVSEETPAEETPQEVAETATEETEEEDMGGLDGLFG